MGQCLTDGSPTQLQYQEAQDFPLPFAQGHRPQVPPQPQICSARNHEGTGEQRCHKRRPQFSPTCTAHERMRHATPLTQGLTTAAEGAQGGQARDCLRYEANGKRRQEKKPKEKPRDGRTVRTTKIPFWATNQANLCCLHSIMQMTGRKSD